MRIVSRVLTQPPDSNKLLFDGGLVVSMASTLSEDKLPGLAFVGNGSREFDRDSARGGKPALSISLTLAANFL